VGKFWGFLFLMVPVLGVGLFAWAPFNNHWLPKDVSSHGHEIDHLFNFILGLTGVVFVITEMLLFWFIWRYDAATNTSPVKFTHGSHNLEIVWTILPAATLLFIAIYQMNAWTDIKLNKPDMPYTVEVTARQFEWRLRYPGADGELGTPDDLHHVNELHVPVDEMVLVKLDSADVLHDFFLPHLRIKQDAVPGTSIPVWFKATEVGEHDLVCAELCGWGHYKMKGRIIIQERPAYEKWLAELRKKQTATGDPEPDETATGEQ
jgi:cytochrome c oxidase subunit II